MEKDEEYNTIDVWIVTDNFKIKDGNKNYFKKFGVTIFGKDKLSEIFLIDITEVSIG